MPAAGAMPPTPGSGGGEEGQKVARWARGNSGVKSPTSPSRDAGGPDAGGTAHGGAKASTTRQEAWGGRPNRSPTQAHLAARATSGRRRPRMGGHWAQATRKGGDLDEEATGHRHLGWEAPGHRHWAQIWYRRTTRGGEPASYSRRTCRAAQADARTAKEEAEGGTPQPAWRRRANLQGRPEDQ